MNSEDYVLQTLYLPRTVHEAIRTTAFQQGVTGPEVLYDIVMKNYPKPTDHRVEGEGASTVVKQAGGG